MTHTGPRDTVFPQDEPVDPALLAENAVDEDALQRLWSALNEGNANAADAGESSGGDGDS